MDDASVVSASSRPRWRRRVRATDHRCQSGLVGSVGEARHQRWTVRATSATPTSWRCASRR